MLKSGELKKMTEAVIVAIITGVCAIVAQVVISKQRAKDLFAALDKHQAVTDTKIEDLTREVREHNEFAKRIPVLEERIKVANNRILDLERQTK